MPTQASDAPLPQCRRRWCGPWPYPNSPAAWPADFRGGCVGSEPGVRHPATDREPVTHWPVPLPGLAKPAILARRVPAQMVRAGSYEAEIDGARRERPRRLRWQARGPREAPKCSRGAGKVRGSSGLDICIKNTGQPRLAQGLRKPIRYVFQLEEIGQTAPTAS
jgi:hypothetical protein